MVRLGEWSPQKLEKGSIKKKLESLSEYVLWGLWRLQRLHIAKIAFHWISLFNAIFFLILDVNEALQVAEKSPCGRWAGADCW